MASIRPFIHHKVVVLHEETPVQQAAAAMCEQTIGCVVVSNDKGQLTGIVTDRDLTCSVIAQSLNQDALIRQVMTTPVVTADENAETEQIIRLMEVHGIRRIPILHTTPRGIQKCIGVITLDDLIASRSIDEYPLIRIVKSQLLRRIRQYQKRASALYLAHSPEPKFPAKKSASDFYDYVANQAGLQKYRNNTQQAHKMIRLTLEALVKRLHHTGAIHLIAQLPLSLQNDLLPLATGPDRTSTVSRVICDFQTEFGMDAESADKALSGIFKALNQTLNQKYFSHVKDQLPEDFRSLSHSFPESKESKAS